MNTIHWGRRETIVTPPLAPIYSNSAIALALILTAAFLRIYIGIVMPLLERYDLWPYIQSGVVAGFRQTDQYRLISVTDRDLHTRPAVTGDVEAGVTGQVQGRPLPLQLTPDARAAGLIEIFRGGKVSYRNGPLHAYLQRFVYGGHTVAGIFRWPLIAGLVVLLGVLPYAARKDIERFREMKYGRLLKGPVRVTPAGFNRAVKGDGVGFKTIESKKLMRIPRLAEGQHIELMGDTDGKTIKSVEHRAGWDATFSAPKSVSLTALVGGDSRVREAHRAAVTTALDELERYTQARLGGNKPAESTGQFIVAKFEHDTARPVDGYAAPQLHTHAVIFNVTERTDGIVENGKEARALQERAFFESQQLATAVYQSELTFRLRELGYEIAPGRSGAPEIKGYSQEYLDASSQRQNQILGISAYREIERKFAVGDRLQFTAPNKKFGVANRDLGTIQKIGEDGKITVRMDGDKEKIINFDSAKIRHFDHGYAVTSHSSQGLTSERVLVNMDTNVHPELINTRFAYVPVSRASHDAQIFTNDAASLAQSLSRDITKASALDFAKAQNPVAKVGLEQAAGVKIAPEAGIGLGL